MQDTTRDKAEDTLLALLSQVQHQAADLMMHPRLDAILKAVNDVVTGAEDSSALFMQNWKVNL